MVPADHADGQTSDSRAHANLQSDKAGKSASGVIRGDTVHTITIAKDADGNDYEVSESLREAPPAWFPGPTPHFIRLPGSFDFLLAGTASDPLELSPAELADELSRDQRITGLPPNVPIVLLVSYGGAMGLDLPRLVAAATNRLVWSFTDRLDVRRYRPEENWFITQFVFSDNRAPAGKWIFTRPGDLGGPRPGPHQVRTMEGSVVDDTEFVSYTITDSLGRPAGRSWMSPEEQAQREHNQLGLTQRTVYRQGRRGEGPIGAALPGTEEPLPWVGLPVYYVSAHGTPGFVRLPEKNEQKTIVVDGGEMGGVLQRRRSLSAQHCAITLMICNAGVAPSPGEPAVAQSVADRTGLIVFAPNSAVSDRLTVASPAPNVPGKWLTFYPSPVAPAQTLPSTSAQEQTPLAPPPSMGRTFTEDAMRTRLPTEPALQEAPPLGQHLTNVAQAERHHPDGAEPSTPTGTIPHVVVSAEVNTTFESDEAARSRGDVQGKGLELWRKFTVQDAPAGRMPVGSAPGTEPQTGHDDAAGVPGPGRATTGTFWVPIRGTVRLPEDDTAFVDTFWVSANGAVHLEERTLNGQVIPEAFADGTLWYRAGHLFIDSSTGLSVDTRRGGRAAPADQLPEDPDSKTLDLPLYTLALTVQGLRFTPATPSPADPSDVTVYVTGTLTDTHPASDITADNPSGRSTQSIPPAPTDPVHAMKPLPPLASAPLAYKPLPPIPATTPADSAPPITLPTIPPAGSRPPHRPSGPRPRNTATPNNAPIPAPIIRSEQAAESGTAGTDEAKALPATPSVDARNTAAQQDEANITAALTDDEHRRSVKATATHTPPGDSRIDADRQTDNAHMAGGGVEGFGLSDGAGGPEVGRASYTAADWAARKDRFPQIVTAETYVDYDRNSNNAAGGPWKVPWKAAFFYVANATSSRVIRVRPDDTTLEETGEELGSRLRQTYDLGSDDTSIVLYAGETGRVPEEGGLPVGQQVANMTRRTVHAPTTRVGSALTSRGEIRSLLYLDRDGRPGAWETFTPEPDDVELDRLTRAAAGLHDGDHGQGAAPAAARERTLQLVRTLRDVYGPAIETTPQYMRLLHGLAVLDTLRRNSGEDARRYNDPEMSPALLRRITQDRFGLSPDTMPTADQCTEVLVSSPHATTVNPPASSVIRGDRVHTITIAKNEDGNDYEVSESLREAPPAWFPGPTPHFIRLPGSFDFVLAGTASDPLELSPAELADELSRDQRITGLPPNVPIVLLVSYGGAMGLDLPRLVAAATNRLVWSFTDRLDVRRYRPEENWFITQFVYSDNRAPAGKWIPTRPGDLGGPRPGPHQVRTMEGSVVDDTEFVSYTITDSLGRPAGRSWMSPEEQAQREHNQLGLTQRTVYGQGRLRGDGSLADTLPGTEKLLPWAGRPVYYVSAHGTPGFVRLPEKNEQKTIVVDGGEMGGVLQRRRSLSAQHCAITLLICDAGVAPSPGEPAVAQSVADRTGLIVFAPNSAVTDRLTVVPPAPNVPGKWLTFYPSPVAPAQTLPSTSAQEQTPLAPPPFMGRTLTEDAMRTRLPTEPNQVTDLVNSAVKRLKAADAAYSTLSGDSALPPTGELASNGQRLRFTPSTLSPIDAAGLSDHLADTTVDAVGTLTKPTSDNTSDRSKQPTPPSPADPVPAEKPLPPLPATPLADKPLPPIPATTPADSAPPAGPVTDFSDAEREELRKLGDLFPHAYISMPPDGWALDDTTTPGQNTAARTRHAQAANTPPPASRPAPPAHYPQRPPKIDYGWETSTPPPDNPSVDLNPTQPTTGTAPLTSQRLRRLLATPFPSSFTLPKIGKAVRATSTTALNTAAAFLSRITPHATLEAAADTFANWKNPLQTTINPQAKPVHIIINTTVHTTIHSYHFSDASTDLPSTAPANHTRTQSTDTDTDPNTPTPTPHSEPAPDEPVETAVRPPSEADVSVTAPTHPGVQSQPHRDESQTPAVGPEPVARPDEGRTAPAWAGNTKALSASDAEAILPVASAGEVNADADKTLTVASTPTSMMAAALGNGEAARPNSVDHAAADAGATTTLAVTGINRANSLVEEQATTHHPAHLTKPVLTTDLMHPLTHLVLEPEEEADLESVRPPSSAPPAPAGEQEEVLSAAEAIAAALTDVPHTTARGTMAGQRLSVTDWVTAELTGIRPEPDPAATNQTVPPAPSTDTDSSEKGAHSTVEDSGFGTHYGGFTVPDINNTNYGLPRKSSDGLRILSDMHNLVIEVRPPNPHAADWLEKGAIPKPAQIKAKSINEIDIHLGAREEHLGLIGYFAPKLPERTADMTDGLWHEIEARYHQRQTEHTRLAPVMEELARQYPVLDGIVHGYDGDGVLQPMTADVDLFDLYTPNQERPLTPTRYASTMDAITTAQKDVQHGPHMYWKPTTEPDKEIFEDIANRHLTGQEPVVVFRPGTGPTLQRFPRRGSTQPETTNPLQQEATDTTQVYAPHHR
ncbi:hypothetical protein ACIOWI_35615 [Streptomyces sp. NPDC087659]|uniref:hypothetical protein n=1 Tax=Streptomyces sp. NPDC087659 TaxID=3365801 RepID=UPI00380652A0